MLCRRRRFRKAATASPNSFPVARIADMLLNPGGTYRYNGKTKTYPDIRLVYWAGGNPFHHHQDLNRLREAFAQVDTLVVHELGWTATARHADFVLPATMTLEREDIGANANDPLLVPMQRIAPPYGEARDDYDDLRRSRRTPRRARSLHRRPQASANGWSICTSRHAKGLAEHGSAGAEFDEFWASDGLIMPQQPDDGGQLRRFRDDPEGAKLPTPSGKVEIFSETIAGFGEPDCPGHPAWLAPVQPAPIGAADPGRQPARDAAAQPARFRRHSAASKHRGREVARMHPADAAARGIADGDIIRLFNERGACLAGVRVTDDIRRGVIQLPTGAWYDPADPDGRNAALRARQSERADARRRHVLSGAGLHRAIDDRRGRAFRRQSAADPGLRSAGGITPRSRSSPPRRERMTGLMLPRARLRPLPSYPRAPRMSASMVSRAGSSKRDR